MKYWQFYITRTVESNFQLIKYDEIVQNKLMHCTLPLVYLQLIFQLCRLFHSFEMAEKQELP